MKDKELLFKPSVSEENGLKVIRDSDVNILSVGISTGGSAEIRMLKGNNQRHVIATTIDNEGLLDTQRILDEEGLSDRIELKYEDVSKKMSYTNEFFDFIYARLVLHYLDDMNLRNTLKELYRVLKKEGLIFIVVRSKNDWEASLEGTTYFEKTGITKYPDYKSFGTDSIKYISRRLHTQDSIISFLKEANFNIVDIKEYDEQLYHDYMRKSKVLHESTVIEVLASK